MPEQRPFDPSEFALVVEPCVAPLRSDLEDAAVQHHVAHLVARDAVDDEQPLTSVESALATIEWTLVRYSAVEEAGEDVLLFADAVSGDLLEVTRILFDEDGELRDFAGAAGNELLYVRSISVAPGYDFVSVAVELLEHVIQHHGAGCFGAAYYRDATPRLELERALRDRGFARVEDEPLFFVSLELERPPLPQAPWDESHESD